MFKLSPQSMSDDHLLPAALLEMGDSLNFIEVRKHTLRQDIKGFKLSSATGKFSGLGSIALGAGAVGLSNPLGWISVGCGVAAYGLHVVEQWHKTGKIQAMPLSSKSQNDRDEDLAGQTVSGDGGNSTGRTSIHEDAAYLSDREKTEYELLHLAPQGIMNAMNHVHPVQRWACYQFLIDAVNAGTFRDYADPKALQDVLGNPAIYQSHLSEASKRFPNYGLPSESLETDSGLAIAGSPVGNQTKINAIEVSSSQVTQSKQNPDLFDFDSLRTEPDSFTGFAIVGDMGTGKTRLIKYLARNILTTGRMSVMDIYARNHDWQGASVLTTVDDFLPEMENDLDQISNLTKAYREGQTVFHPHLFVVEEAADTLSEASDQGRNEAKTVGRWLSKYLTITRKIGKRLCLVSVNIKDLTDAIGSAEKRNSMVFIFPGRAAIAKAMTDTYIFKLGTIENRELREKLEKSIALIKRPALIQHRGQWWVAVIPEVNEDGSLIDGSSPDIAATVQAPEPKPKTAGTPQDLERMFNAPSAQHEATGEIEENTIESVSSLSTVQATFPNWKPESQDVAAKIVDFLAAKPDKTYSPSEVKKSIWQLKNDATLTKDCLKRFFDLLTEKQFLSVDELGRYAISQNSDVIDL